MELSFPAVAQAALDHASTLLPEWMGGRRQGREWVGERKANGGIGDSWSVNLDTGVWACFASGIKGHDLIGLYAELNHVGQGAAAQAIVEQLHLEAVDIPRLPARLPPERAAERPWEPIPEDAPALLPHPHLGPPTATYRYGNRFWVTRHDTDVGKSFLQWTWRNGHWARKGPGPNRPLFHVEQLAKHPAAPVLIVEGERCVERAAPILTGFVVLTWSGGAQAVKQSDWSCLAGRDVIVWPDADAPGRAAAAIIATRLADQAQRVRVVNPGDVEPGWDIADAIDEGWDLEPLTAFMRTHMVDSVTLPPRAQSNDAPLPESMPAGSSLVPEAPPESGPVSWSSLGLDSNEGGVPHPTLANASAILQLHRDFKARIWFDEFRGRIYHTLTSAVAQPWTDRDTRRVTVTIQQQLRLPKFQLSLVHEAITHAAESHPRHSLRDWLDSLVWDGVERLDIWLGDAAGVTLDEYTQAVGRNWLIGMVARAYHPGCKMDNMPVLEGVSGLKKTQFLQVLGGEWYRSLTMQFGEKDFLQALRGAWLVEIPDMAGFTRSEHTKVLATITTDVDSYRVPYGRVPEDVPRTCVFAATSETDDYLSDPRGKRRYWPIRCTDIDLNTLREQRPKLFAEAVQRYRQGIKWYEVPGALAAQEQLDRTEPDEWTEDILRAANLWWTEYLRRTEGNKITAKRLLTLVLNIDLGDITTGQCRRVTAILRAAGWRRQRDGYGFYWLKHA